MEFVDFKSGDSIPAEAIPAELLPRIGPDAPAPAKSLIARAMLPMPPDQLGVALAILARDTDAELAETATASLVDLPDDVVRGIVSDDQLSGPILDVFAHVLAEKPMLLQTLMVNRSVLDQSVEWTAGHARGGPLETISTNQVRLVRYPMILQALLENPATPSSVLARVVETLIRNKADTSGIGGFSTLAKSFGLDIRALGGKEAEPEPEPEATAEPEAEAEDAPVEDEGLDAAGMESVLARQASVEADSKLLAPEKTEEEKEKEISAPMWKQIQSMSTPQKVRLALVGDKNARKVLVRDTKNIVAEAVMRSPRLTPKEVSAFVNDKAVSGNIIKMIAKSKLWTKSSIVQRSLTHHPKCPPTIALRFVKSMGRKELSGLMRARGVPGVIKRAAKTRLQVLSG